MLLLFPHLYSPPRLASLKFNQNQGSVYVTFLTKIFQLPTQWSPCLLTLVAKDIPALLPVSHSEFLVPACQVSSLCSRCTVYIYFLPYFAHALFSPSSPEWTTNTTLIIKVPRFILAPPHLTLLSLKQLLW